tara:strand:+ start:11053 stop:11427 length:375 start_codon:yes stop_codon:yes gene_type:complete
LSVEQDADVLLGDATDACERFVDPTYVFSGVFEAGDAAIFVSVDTDQDCVNRVFGSPDARREGETYEQRAEDKRLETKHHKLLCVREDTIQCIRWSSIMTYIVDEGKTFMSKHFGYVSIRMFFF